MTILEGVGDEVVQFVAVILVIIVVVLAWWSTNANHNRYRTLLVMRSRPLHPAITLSIRTRSIMMITNGQNIQGSPSGDIAGNVDSTDDSNRVDNARVIPLQEMDSIVDADTAMLDNNRLHFYRRIDTERNSDESLLNIDENVEQEGAEPAGNEQMREMDGMVNALENEIDPHCTGVPCGHLDDLREAQRARREAARAKERANSTANVAQQSTSSEPTEPDRKILIKLKYLNDTLKEVEGRLDELLKDFKWRHFASELTAECRVRLIFNGRCLADESTLRACGLFDRAVVHCLVHPKANQNDPPRTHPDGLDITHALFAQPHPLPPPERPWDLENILMTLVSVALTIVWFFRCEYSNMFTASASVALFGLTVFYSVAIFGLYLTDTFQFDRRRTPRTQTPAADPQTANE